MSTLLSFTHRFFVHLMVLSCGLALFAISARATDINWTNTAGGLWSTAANWSPNQVPGSGDNALINADGTYVVTLASTTTIAGLSVGAGSGAQTLLISTPSLTLNGPGTISGHGILTMAGGTSINGPGDLTITTVFNWNGGTFSGTGKTIIAVGATATLNSSSTKGLDSTRVFENRGTVTWLQGGIDLNPLNTGGSGSITNISGALFDIQADNNITATGSLDVNSPAPSFNNAGTLRRSVSSGAAAIYVPLVNTSTVDVQTGTLQLFGGGSTTGTINVALPATFAPETFVFGTGAQLTGAGEFLFDSGTQTFNFDQIIPRARMTAGTIVGTANVTITNFTWQAGLMTGAGRTIIPVGGTATFSGSQTKSLDSTRVFENRGTVTWTGGAIDLNAVNTGGSGRIENSSGGLFDIQSDNQVFATASGDVNSPGPSLSNLGTLRKSAGSGTTTISVVFTNASSVDVQMGTLRITGNGESTGTINVAAAATFAPQSLTFGTGSQLTGAGMCLFDTGTQTFSVDHAVPAVKLDGGNIAGTGTVTITNLAWTTGNMSGAGRVLIPVGGSATLSTGNTKGLDSTRVFENQGTVTWTGGTLDLNVGSTGGSGRITNAASGLFDFKTDSQMTATQYGDLNSPAPRFDNFGTVRKSAGSGTTTVAVVFTNASSVDVQIGTLRLTAGGSSAANISVGSGATFAPQSLTFSTGSQLIGAGTCLLDTGTQTFSADHAIPNVQLNGGNITGAGTVTITNLAWMTGNMSGAGRVIIPLAGTATLSTGNTKGVDSTRVFENQGTVTWTAGVIDLNVGSSGGSGRIENSSGLFDMQADNSISATGFSDVNSPAAQFSNSGTLRRSVGVNTATIAVAFVNFGAVEVQTGTLRLTGGGSSSNTVTASTSATFAPQSLTFSTGSQLLGDGEHLFDSGTQTFSFDHAIPRARLNGGTVAGTATVTITNFTWSSGTMAAAGKTIIPANGSASITTGNAKGLDSGRIFENHGVMNWTGGDFDLNALSTGGPGRINNAVDGTFNLQSDNLIGATGFGDTGVEVARVDNAGMIRKTAGSATSGFSVPFFNTGQVDVQVATIRASGGGTNTGIINVSGASAIFAPQTFSFNTGSQLIGPGEILLDGGTQNFSVDHAIGRVRMASSQGETLAGAGNVTITNLNWQLGTMGSGGRTIIPSGGTATLSTGNFKGLDALRVLENHGTVALTAGSIEFNATSSGGPGRIENAANGVFDLQGDNPFTVTGFGDVNVAVARIDNLGIFKKTGGTGISDLSVQFNNGGSVDVQTGTLRIQGGGTNTGTINAAQAGTFVPRTMGFENGSQLTGAGEFLFDGGTQTFNVAHTIPRARLTGGTLAGTANVTINQFTWTAGNMAAAAHTIIPLLGSATLSGGSTKGLDAARVFENQGTVFWTGGTIDLNAGNTGGSGRIDNAGLFEIQTDSAISATGFADVNSPAPQMSNSGTLRKGSTTGITSISVPLSNTAATVINTGVLNLSGGFTTTAGGSLGFGIGGLIAATNFGKLQVSGTLALSGTLNLTLLNGFTPAQGDQFAIITATARTGTFDTVSGQSLSGNLFLNPTYSATGVSIVATDAAPKLTGLLSLTPGHFHVEGIAGQTYRVDGSTNLTNWVELTTSVVPGSAFIDFVDADAGTIPYRFYRALFNPVGK